jgi:hypothetical protein
MRPIYLVATLAVSLVTAANVVVARPAATCQRVAFSPVEPGWISSAVFVPARDRLLLVDASRSKLLLASTTGETTFLTGAAAEHAEMPALLATMGDGFLLKLVKPTLLSLDKNLALRNELQLRTAGSAQQPVAGPFYQWTVAGPSIVAYGSIRAQHDYTLGFLRLPASDETAPPEMLKPFTANDFYAVGYQYLTAIGSTAYFLAMGDTVELNKVPAGLKPVLLPMKGLPADFQRLSPIRKEANSPGDFRALYQELEGKTMPVSLQAGVDGSLYLLTRRPAGTGATTWEIYRISAEGVVQGFGRLATKAKHVTVVPSAATWYFIERGEVDSGGHQKIGSMLEVPSGRLSGMTQTGGEVCPDIAQ